MTETERFVRDRVAATGKPCLFVPTDRGQTMWAYRVDLMVLGGEDDSLFRLEWLGWVEPETWAELAAIMGLDAAGLYEKFRDKVPEDLNTELGEFAYQFVPATHDQFGTALREVRRWVPVPPEGCQYVAVEPEFPCVDGLYRVEANALGVGPLP